MGICLLCFMYMQWQWDNDGSNTPKMAALTPECFATPIPYWAETVSEVWLKGKESDAQ